MSDYLYSANAVANTILKRGELKQIKNITPMKLQKLLFFAQVWHIKLYGAPLFDDPIERWQYGPVVRSVYYEFRSFSSCPITKKAMDASGMEPFVQPEDGRSLALIDKILDVYGQYNATQLSGLTHQDGGAWKMDKVGTFISFEQLQSGAV